MKIIFIKLFLALFICFFANMTFAQNVKGKKKGVIIKSEKLLSTQKQKPFSISFVKQNNLYGIKKGSHWLITPSYDTLIWIDKTVGIIHAKKNDQHGIINTSGKEILSFIYDWLEFYPDLFLYEISTESGSGIVDMNGRIIIEPIYEMVSPISSYSSIKEDRGVAWKETGKLNLIRVRTVTEKYYLFNTQGRKLYDYAFDEINESSYNKAISFKLNGSYGFFDESGAVRVKPQYTYVKWYSQGLAAVQKNELWGFVDYLGNEAISFQFSNAMPFQEGLAAVKIREKWGYVNQRGYMIIRPKYEDAFDFSEGKAFVSKENSYLCNNRSERFFYGVIDMNENEILPFQYDVGSILRDMHFENGIACNVEKFGCNEEDGHLTSYGTFCIDEKGNTVRKD